VTPVYFFAAYPGKAAGASVSGSAGGSRPAGGGFTPAGRPSSGPGEEAGG